MKKYYIQVINRLTGNLLFMGHFKAKYSSEALWETRYARRFRRYKKLLITVYDRNHLEYRKPKILFKLYTQKS